MCPVFGSVRNVSSVWKCSQCVPCLEVFAMCPVLGSVRNVSSVWKCSQCVQCLDPVYATVRRQKHSIGWDDCVINMFIVLPRLCWHAAICRLLRIYFHSWGVGFMLLCKNGIMAKDSPLITLQRITTFNVALVFWLFF